MVVKLLTPYCNSWNKGRQGLLFNQFSSFKVCRIKYKKKIQRIRKVLTTKSILMTVIDCDATYIGESSRSGE